MPLPKDFERFRGGPLLSTRNRMHVTLRPKGDIFFNSNTHRRLGHPEEVVLAYSAESDTIAISPVTERNRIENFPVQKCQTGFRIRSSPLIRHYGIRVKGTQRFINPEIREGRYLMLNLRETVNVPSAKAKKKTA